MAVGVLDNERLRGLWRAMHETRLSRRVRGAGRTSNLKRGSFESNTVNERHEP